MNKKIFFTLLSTIWTTIWKQVQTSFRYRRAGGDDNNKLPGNNCQAKIEKIYGNTVRWNQLVKNGNFSDTSEWIPWTAVLPASLSVTDNIGTVTKSTAGAYGGFLYNDGVVAYTTHKYYLSAYLASTSSANAALYYMFITSNGTEGNNVRVQSNTTELKRYSKIVSPKNNTDRLCLRIGTSVTPVDSAGRAANVLCIDLTQLFGTDDEIATALDISTSDITTEVGVVAFESWLALNIGTQDYYPYDPGSLISFKGQSVKSVGFNQWDEEWEVGRISAVNGGYETSTGIRSKNFIRVFPNTQYYGIAGRSTYVICYDINKNFVYTTWQEHDPAGVNYKNINGSVFTIPSGIYYIKFYQTAYSTYDHDTCINFSDPAKNGIYKPYWEDVLTIDPTKIYGKASGEGSYVQCFPDGMLSVGSVHDTLSVNEAVKKIDSVNLGSLNWTKGIYSGHDYYTSNSSIAGIKKPASNTQIMANLLCVLFEPNKTFDTLGGSGTWIAVSSDGRIGINQPGSYTDATEFKTAMNGVMLNYELDTQLVYTDLIYSEDGGVTGIPLSEFKYKVDKYSTEELIVPTDSTGAPTSTPIIADITYQYKGGGYNWIGTELEWIESTGTQYIDTGIKTTGSYSTKMKFQYTESNQNGTVFGVLAENGSNYYGFDVTSNNNYRLWYGSGGSPWVIFGTSDLEQHTVLLKNGSIYLDNNTSPSATSSLTLTSQSRTMVLFAARFSGNPLYHPAKARIFSCKIWNNDTLIQDLVPYKDPHGIVCMYDKVSRSFFYNKGTGDFIAGPAKDLPGGGIEN